MTRIWDTCCLLTGGRRVRRRLQTRPTPLLGLIYCRRLSVRRSALDERPHIMSAVSDDIFSCLICCTLRSCSKDWYYCCWYGVVTVVVVVSRYSGLRVKLLDGCRASGRGADSEAAGRETAAGEWCWATQSDHRAVVETQHAARRMTHCTVLHCVCVIIRFVAPVPTWQVRAQLHVCPIRSSIINCPSCKSHSWSARFLLFIPCYLERHPTFR